MVSPQLVKYKIAKALAASLKDSIEFLYSNYKAEYVLLRERFPDDEHYRREVQKLLNDFQSSVKKVIGSDEIDIENHLFYELTKLEFREGLNPNYESFVKLLEWSSENREVSYLVHNALDETNLGKFDAKKVGGEIIESIHFNFSYLENEFTRAIRAFAQLRLIYEINSDDFNSKGPDIVNEPEEELTHKTKAKLIRDKLNWLGDKKILEQMFIKLSKHTFEESGKNVIEATDGQIKKLINSNFYFSAEAKSEPAIEPTERILYNGEVAALVRLFYILEKKKLDDGFELLRHNPKSIWLFIESNFKWYKKEENRVMLIEYKTIKDTWSKIERKKTKNLQRFLDNESKPKVIKNSLLNIVADTLTAR